MEPNLRGQVVGKPQNKWMKKRRNRGITEQMKPRPSTENLSHGAEPPAPCARHQHLERVLERGVGMGGGQDRGTPLCGWVS